jgi:hypothetical protein
MLCALLETIGTLGILLSLTAKLGKPSADAMACGTDGSSAESMGDHEKAP